MTSRTDLFLARIAQHLPSLSCNAARRAFLEQQHTKFEQSYLIFQAHVARGEDVGDRTAWDYTETLLALEAEMAKYESVAA